MSRPYFFFFLSNASSTPPPQSAPSFFLHKGGRKRDREKSGREREGRGGGAGFGFGVRKQMKAEFFFSQRYRRKLHAMPHTDTSGYSLYLKVHMVRLLLQPRHSVTQKKPHTHFLFIISPLFSPPTPHLHPFTPPCALCCALHPIPLILMCDRERISAWERENCPFHSIRLTAPQTLSICSLILSLFQFDQI